MLPATPSSFYFDRDQRTCKTVSFPVGILPPDWLRGALLLGQEVVDSRFTCRVWTKAAFVRYYEDVEVGPTPAPPGCCFSLLHYQSQSSVAC